MHGRHSSYIGPMDVENPEGRGMTAISAVMADPLLSGRTTYYRDSHGESLASGGTRLFSF